MTAGAHAPEEGTATPIDDGLDGREAGIVALARRLARERFAGRAARDDLEGTFPAENYRDLAAENLLALAIPRAYGGLGVSWRAYLLVLLEVAKACGSTALTLNMHTSVTRLLDALASPEQKARYFREVVQHGRCFATITSEPATSFRGTFTFSTFSRPVDGGYLINGHKHFCSLAGAAGRYLVWSQLEGTRSVREGLLTTVVDAGNPGVRVEPTWNSMAMRATNSHSMRFADCFVPEEDRVGEPGEAVRRQLSDVFNPGYAAVYLGVAEGALDFAAEYARTRTFKPNPHPIGHEPLVQRQVGELDVRLRAARLLLLEAAEACDRGLDAAARAPYLSRAKYFCCETALAVTDGCLRVVGGRGVSRDAPLERHIRDARAGVVMPPNSDACLETAGRAALGLPASGGIYGE